MNASVPIIDVSTISKCFGATRALERVSLSIAAGEIVALMGANGAGKSTLVKILSGALAPDTGDIFVGGQRVSIRSPQDAKAQGIATVHQQADQTGAPGLSVAENLMLEELCSSRGRLFISARAIRRRAAQIAATLDLDIGLDRDFAELAPAEKQLIAIARAVVSRSRLLILDEPTSTLSTREAERLFALIERLRSAGIAVLYISHRIADLSRLADRVVVLRGGTVVSKQARPIDFQAAIASMIGHALDVDDRRMAFRDAARILDVDGLKLAPDAKPFNLRIHAGEVVAITGALGSGKSRLLRILYGLEKSFGGTIAIDGRSWRPAGPGESIAFGVVMVAEDRWRSSLFPATTLSGTIAGSIAFPHLRRWFRNGLVKRRVEDAAARAAIAGLGIRARGPGDRLEELSGGNQQKVVLARWQAEPARLLLLDEPFQGVDVGARADLVAAIRSRSDGAATLIATSDAEEALQVADRIFVMRDRTLVEASADEGAGSLLAALGRVEAAATASS